METHPVPLARTDVQIVEVHLVTRPRAQMIQVQRTQPPVVQVELNVECYQILIRIQSRKMYQFLILLPQILLDSLMRAITTIIGLLYLLRNPQARFKTK